ncbi:MAG TPA: DNA mismatch repair protein MutS [bacterium]|nr:DNA mismatch repair protein MutS [bacterium]
MAAKGTPMMEQFQAIKDQNPDCLVFFRLGDFYELFGEDAKEASRLLGLTLTARSSGEGRSVKVPMAGVPYHAAPGYIQRLLRAGRKIAVCEQMGDPKAKGGMTRELVRVHTPGTALEDGYLDERSNNYLAALARDRDGGLGLAWADNTTGEFAAMLLPPDAAGLEAELERLRPAELLLPDQGLDPAIEAALRNSPALQSRLDPFQFDPASAARALREQFHVATLEGYGLKDGSPALGAAGALLGYLKRTQRSSLAHLNGLRLHEEARFLRLDAAAQRHLELVQNLEDGGTAHTLFSVLDHSVTAPGARCLKRWLVAPLLALEPIAQRHDAVAALAAPGALRAGLREALRQAADLERVVGKVGCGAAGPRDLAGVRQTLRALPALSAALRERAEALLQAPALGALGPLLGALEAGLVEDPPALLRDSGFIRPGYDAALDEAVADGSGAREKVLAVQERERERSGNPKLKVQFNSVFGYYIEVSKAQSGSVPADYERKQTLVGAERYTTPELKGIEQGVFTAEERRKAREALLFEALRLEVAGQSAPLLHLAGRLAELDSLAALAEAASAGAWVRPDMDDGTVLDIQEGRHPVVEALLRRDGASFVANDCLLDADQAQLLLITGPNMAGKSTYMRQVALIALLAQCGSFVPARSARVGLIDRIFTRVGASDRLSRGMSTFLVEMTKTASILRHASRRSLVVLDEIGRGTSTYDGVSIAWAVAEYLHESIGCRCLFATHYFELAELEKRLPRVRNFSVAVREWEGRIVFLHSVKAGSSEHSYGVAVARLAGVPEPVIRRAREVLASLELHRRPPASLAGGVPQMDLFGAAAVDPALEALALRLGSLDTDSLTPLQALQELHAMKALVDRKEGG